jgi:GntP family gluconate:H+ symporter
MPPAWHIFLVIVASVLLVVVATVRWKLHPFLSLLCASLCTGMMLGMPFADLARAVGRGFGDMAGTIGIIIALGSLIGVYMEESGAARLIAWKMFRLAGMKTAGFMMSLIGALVGIPVFCDSGFIMLSAPARSMAVISGKPNGVLPLAAATGLYATHVLVPPTPGPLAAAGNLGAADMMGTVIFVGLLMALPAILAGYAWAKLAGRSMVPENQGIDDAEVNIQRLPKLPLLYALTPILLPILLIMAGNAAKILWPATTWSGILQAAGNPIIALGLGFSSCLLIFRKDPGKDHAGWMNKALNQAGPIVLITSAGGSFGAVLKAAPLDKMLGEWFSGGSMHGLTLLPVLYLVAAVLKTAQGSSTAAMIIASSLAAPLLNASGMHAPLQLSLLVSVIGAGAMTVSHTNDSYFWVVSRFGGLSTAQTLRGLTLSSFFMGLAVLLTAIVVWTIAFG